VDRTQGLGGDFEGRGTGGCTVPSSVPFLLDRNRADEGVSVRDEQSGWKEQRQLLATFGVTVLQTPQSFSIPHLIVNVRLSDAGYRRQLDFHNPEGVGFSAMSLPTEAAASSRRRQSPLHLLPPSRISWINAG